MTQTSRRVRQLAELLAPASGTPAATSGCSSCSRKSSFARSAKTTSATRCAVDRRRRPEHALPQLAHDRVAHVRVGAQQVVDDLVARDGRGARLPERIEGLALPGADAAGDRDRDRSRHVLGRLVGLGLVAGRRIGIGGRLRHRLVACSRVGVGGRLGLELDLGRGVRLRRRRILELRLGGCLGLGCRNNGFGFGLRSDRGSGSAAASASGSAAASASGSVAASASALGASVAVASGSSAASGSSGASSSPAAGREDVLGEIQVRRQVHRLAAVGARERLRAFLDPLQREREAAALGVDLEDQGR